MPLPWGTGPDEWLAALDQTTAWVEGHGAGALVVSVGVDTFEQDPISKFKLPTSTYPTIGARLAGLGLPTVLVMEGGYATDELADNVAGVVNGFEAAANQQSAS